MRPLYGDAADIQRRQEEKERLARHSADAEQLSELRKQYRTAMFALKETAFSYHVEAEHQAAFAACTNVMCRQACQMFNSYPTVINPVLNPSHSQEEKETQ